MVNAAQEFAPQSPPAANGGLPHPTAPGAVPRSVLLAAGAVLLFALQLAYVQHGTLAFDEYQHMHSAYLVSQGETPFVDFFEHHTPLFYYVAAALIPMRNPSFETMIHARYLSLAVHLLTVALAALWVRAVVGGASALVVTVLLAGDFCFFIWGTRTYLDTWAAPLLLLSAMTLPVRRQSSLRSMLSGASLALAVLVTQKAVWAALAPAVVFALRAADARADASRRRAVWRDFAAWAAGGVAPVALLPALLGVDGMKGMVRDAVVLNLHWKARHFPSRILLMLFASDACVYVATLYGVIAGGLRLVRRRFAIAESDLPWVYLLALGAGIFLTPVVWEEYFILLLPFAVVVAGVTLVELWRTHLEFAVRCATPLWWSAAIVGVLAGTQVFDLAVLRFGARNPLSLPAFAIVVGLWIGLASLIVWTWRRGSSWQSTLWVLLIIALPVVEQADWIPRHRNDPERARVDYIMATTKPTEPVFDGRSGFGVFRPHAYKYWFLHDEMQLMLSDEEKGPDIIRALEQKKVPVVIVDDFTKMLPAPVLRYIATHYVDTPFPDIKRRAHEDRQ